MEKKHRDKFITFLRESGAEILEPTNQYELVRFRTVNGVSVVYTGKRGTKFTGESAEAYNKFQKKDIWQIKKAKVKEREALIEHIISRDGLNCFYCGTETKRGETSSIEHLLSISHGGNNNPSNLTISCRSCNDTVGNMSIVEKVFYRETVHKDFKTKRKTK